MHVYEYFPAWMCATYKYLVPSEVRIEHQMPWNWSDVFVSQLGTKLGSSARAAITLTC